MNRTKAHGRTRRLKAKSKHQTNAGEEKMSLAGFKDVEWPDVLPVKLVYNDYRAVVASGNQATYVYRLNSCFDPDQTGVGGQPAGFDQLKALYGRYRVVAVRARVSCSCATSGGGAFLAIAPVDNSALTSIAEDVASLRHAASMALSNNSKLAVCDKLWHIGELLGYSDESVLANSNMDAAVTGNPGFQQYLLISVETSGATDQVSLQTELTYYTRMEVPTAVEDASRGIKGRALARLQPKICSTIPCPASPTTTAPDSVFSRASDTSDRVGVDGRETTRTPLLSTSALPLGATELVATMQRQCTVTSGYCLSCSTPVSPSAGLPLQGK